MADIIVIGGGITGLAAAYELQKNGIPYTLIEVKNRLGGSVISERRSGFVLDGGPFVLHRTKPWTFLDELGLVDAVYRVVDLPNGHELVAFKNGTQTLTDALANRLDSGRIITQMAVSTIGKVDDCFAVCLENGMVLEASALIITAPARHAERMFYTYQPELSLKLRKFPYDTITRVSLGYRREQIPLPIIAPPDPSFAFSRWTDSPYRVPPGHLLLQVGMRFPLTRTTPEALVRELQRVMNWPDKPVVQRVDYWQDSHALAPHDPAHDATMAAIESLLPPGVVLAGGDYRAKLFEDRVFDGLAAAHKLYAR